MCRETEKAHEAQKLDTLRLEAAAEQQRWEAYEVSHMPRRPACATFDICTAPVPCLQGWQMLLVHARAR